MTEFVVTVGIPLGLVIAGGVVWAAFRQRRRSRRLV
jgi:hypothetical protein